MDELDSLVREIEAGEATLPARRLLAIALARKGDMSGAETQARAVLASEAADPSMLFLQGLAHEKRDELVEAVDCYAQVLEEEPDAWRAHFHLAKLHLNVGLVAAAAGHLRSTLEVNPDFAPAQEAMDKLSGIDVEALQARSHRGRISPISRLYTSPISPPHLSCRRASTKASITRSIPRLTRGATATGQLRRRLRPRPSPLTSPRWATSLQTRRGSGGRDIRASRRPFAEHTVG